MCGKCGKHRVIGPVAIPSVRSSEIGGFRIFKVNDGSPAAEAGLEVFFDFIVEINGVLMDADQTTFAKAIQDAENQRTKLVVQNIRTHTPGHSVQLPTSAFRNGGYQNQPVQKINT